MSAALMAARKQARWDELLIEGWRGDRKMYWVAIEWAKHFGYAPPYSIADLMPEFRQINRVPPWSYEWKTPVKVFMGRYLRRVSDMLFDGKPTAAALGVLRNADLDREPRAHVFDRASLHERRRFVVLNLRDRDKRHDWKTVK